MPFTHTLVLTALPGSGDVTDSVTRAAAGAFDARDVSATWLSRGDAWDLPFEAGPDVRALPDAIAAAIGNPPIDINVVGGHGTGRRKRLLCADMESTIIEQELIDEIAKLAGRHDEIAAVTKAAMRGELDFEASLIKRVALFEGLAAEHLEPLLSRTTLMPGAETLVRTMQANGGRCALVSGGFTLFAERIAERLGFDAVFANVLEIKEGKLTGRVREPILGPAGKAEALRSLAAEFGADISETLAVGDGANDTGMLAAAGLGVAFRAKPILAAQARNADNGAVIAHGDLTALLYLQGLRRDQFAS